MCAGSTNDGPQTEGEQAKCSGGLGIGDNHYLEFRRKEQKCMLSSAHVPTLGCKLKLEVCLQVGIMIMSILIEEGQPKITKTATAQWHILPYPFLTKNSMTCKLQSSSHFLPKKKLHKKTFQDNLMRTLNDKGECTTQKYHTLKESQPKRKAIYSVSKETKLVEQPEENAKIDKINIINKRGYYTLKLV